MDGQIVAHEIGGSLPGALCGSHLGSLGLRVTAWRDHPDLDLPRRYGWDFSKDVRSGSPVQEVLSGADLVIDGRPLRAAPVEGAAVVCRILGDWDAGIEEMPEVVAQAKTGLVGYVGRGTEPPVRIGAPVVTMTTAVAAVQASLAALYWRRRWRRPCTVTVTAVGAALTLLSNNVTSESDPDKRDSFAAMQWGEPERGFQCKDGVVDFSFYRDDGGFARFCQWLGRPDLLDDERFNSMAARFQNAKALNADLRSLLADRPVKDVLAELDKAGAIYSRRYPVAELPAHPQVEFLGLLRRLPWDGSEQIVVQVPFSIDGVRPRAEPIRHVTEER
jgi:CoA-transferase family III